MATSVFVEIGLIIVIATFAVAILKLLKQPTVIAYIIAGILVGPSFLNIVKSHDTILTFSQIGIALLLFMVGLNLSPKIIKQVGPVAIVTGLGQIIFTFIITFMISKFIGFTSIISAYLAIALTFSSTIIIMKLLSDKGDLDTLYGRISVGFLIVQDIVAILILMLISSAMNGSGLQTINLPILAVGIGLLAGLFTLTIYVFPKIDKLIARSQEFLYVFSLGWLFALAAVFGYLGFSIEIGALLAGISLSMSPYKLEISSRIKPLRDFFIILFFIFLGAQMTFASVEQHWASIAVFSLLVLIGNPIIVMVLMGAMKYSKRTGFLSGLTVAQISEFSFIVVALGVSAGHIPDDIISLVTVVALITIAVSTYFILYAEKLYRKLSPHLGIFESRGAKKDQKKHNKLDKHDIILFGYNRIGFGLLKSFTKINKPFLVVDYNPDTISKLVDEGIDCKFGDATDAELLEEINLKSAKMIISTIPKIATNLMLINKVRKKNKRCIILVVAHDIEDSNTLYRTGANFVIMPHFLGSQYAATMIEKLKFDSAKFRKEKIKHLKHLKRMMKEGHRHPRREGD